MKFGRAHWIVTTALAAFGILAVVGTVPLPGLSPVQVVAELLIAAQLVALATRRGATNDGAIFAIALVHVVAGTVFGGGLTFLVAFLGLAVVVPAALVLSHLRREVEGNYQQGARDRTGLPVDVPRILRSRRVMGRGTLAVLGSLSLPLLGVTAALFLVLPRFGVSARGLWPLGLTLEQPGLVRFTDHVDLGQRGELHSNPAVALRFRVSGIETPQPPARLPIRFRGTDVDTFDGRAWTRTAPPSMTPPSTVAPAGARAITVEREPFDPPALFLPSGTIAVRMDDERHYVAYVQERGAVRSEALGVGERARYLASPVLSKRTIGLAHAWADPEPTPAAKARAIEEHLRKDFAYSLASPSRGAEQPIDHFLFESRRGHCELFASTMAMMLREVGIPSRSVLGFLGGTYNRFGGYYVVRQGEAHQWVEAWVADADVGGAGWQTFDPTPTSSLANVVETGMMASTRDFGDTIARRWGSEVVDYDRRTRASIAGMFFVKLAVAIAIVILILYGLRRGVGREARRAWKRLYLGSANGDPERHEATELYASLEAALVTQGVVRDRAFPPLAHAESLVEQRHPLAEDVIALTRRYLAARFGGQPLDGEARRDFARAISRFSRGQPGS